VIFSSRTIPGNEKEVGRVVNGLIDQGITVITDRTHLVHVSGHPRRAELEDLIGWVKPQILIPVHGEALHLSEHAALGKKLGIPHVLQCRNGDLVQLAPGAPAIIDQLPFGRMFKDGKLLIAGESTTIAERRRLSFGGMISVALAVTEKGVLAADPEIDLQGIPEHAANGELLSDLAYNAALDTFENMPKQRRRDPDTVAEAVRRAVRAAVAMHWGKKPVCHVHVLTV
jgi:ribonuclease J